MRAIVFLAYDGVLLLDVAGPAEVFATASDAMRRRTGREAYRIALRSLAGGKVTTDTGLVLDTEPMVPGAPLDTLVVPGGRGLESIAADDRRVRWVAETAPAARRTCSVCLGAFVLAAAGLLDGRRAVTHWRYCADLAARFPAVQVEPDAIFAQSGAVWTSAGVSAGIDLALALVEEDLGHDVALEVAQRLVVFLKRPGGQAQFSRTLAAQAADAGGRFDRLHAYIADNLGEDLTVERLAARAGMAVRSFTRAYAAETGTTPARAVEAMRVEAARRLLVGSDLSVQQVAARAGFGDDERLRRSFLRQFGVAPQDYRIRFGERIGEPDAGSSALQH